MVLSCSSVHVCVPKHDILQFLTRYALWDRDERFTVLDQKVKGQGHGGITNAVTITVQANAYITRRLVSS